MSELSLLIKTLQLHFVFGIVFFIFPIQKVHSEQIDSTLFELKVDFSKNSSPVWDGFSGFFAEHENNSSFLPQTYTINGNVITVEIAWPAGTVKEVKQMIDRGGNAGVEGSDLLRDWIGTDGRKERVPIVMTIKGVPPGVYEWKSFHHDNNDQTGVFNVEIKDALHSFTIKGVDISNGILPINSVTTLQTTLKSDSSDITFSFEMNSYPDNSTSFFVMNGFIINELDTSVVPGQVDLISPLNNLKYLSSDVEFKWTESYFANSYNLFLGKQNPPTLYATVDSLGYRTSDLEENTTYFWSVEAVNNNGSTNSEIRSFTTGDKNSTSFSGNLELTFSKERGFYDDPFQLEINVNSAGANIIYTVDCSTPSVENGLIYTKPVSIDSTTVIKAFALSSKSHSAVTTESYIFSSFVLKQGKKPSGFPETWAGKTIINADYEMDPEIIESPDYKSKINSAIKSVPSLSLTMDVDNWFNDKTGLYVGYPNSNETREKAVSAEFIFHDKDNFLVECGVQNQGGTSIINWKVPKQSMRLLFKEIYGTSRLHYKLFPNSDINSINTLVIDGLLYSWLHPWDDKQRVTSLYFRDQLASDLQNEMGELSFHGIYVHLFINGLYWGLYDLHERPDDAFLSEYFNAEREDFDIIKHNPNSIVSGSNNSYLKLLEEANKGFSSYSKLKNIENYLDLPAFIDYMILNFYLGNYDWAHQNFYAACNVAAQTGYRFYTWDAEHVMRYSDVNYNNTKKDDKGGPTEIHTLLKENSEYRMMFADAVYKHCFNDGALSPANFEKSFLFRKNEIDDAVILESARWGDFLEGKTGVTYTRDDYWIPEVNKVIEEYIPQRRDIFIEQLRDSDNKLFPDFMPPKIEVEEKSYSKKDVTLLLSNYVSGDIYFTLDGTDPRLIGGGISGTKYIEKITIGSTTILKARIRTSDKKWSALTEKVFLFDDVFGGSLVINEIMYHPENNYPEFIEVMNFGENPVNISGFKFSKGINYTFDSNEIIQPGAGVVLTNDGQLFKSVYNFDAFGQYEKKLSNSGETVILMNGLNQVVDSVTYSDTIPWPVNADGDGYSLELIDSDMDNALWSSWKTSDEIYGSPYTTIADSEIEAGIYPNPFSDKITIKINTELLSTEVLNINVFNQLGSKVKAIQSTSNNSEIEINLSGILPGIYFIRIDASKNTQFKGAVLKAIKL